MGTDIHVWLAARDSPEAEWNLILSDPYGSEFYSDRNYSFFRALAGIRHPRYGVSHIVNSEGLPKNCSSQLLEFSKEHFYGHSLMHCSFDEWYQAIELMFSGYYEDRGDELLGYDLQECSEYRALLTMKQYMSDYVTETEASLNEELKLFFNPESRIIFWFDS